MTDALSNLSGTVSRFAASRLVQNVGALALVQASSYVVPLLTLPYLVRVLGVDDYGSVAFAQGLVAYFAVVVGWGFEWSAVRRVSLISMHSAESGAYVANVFAARLMLYFSCLVMGAPLLFAAPQIYANKELIAILCIWLLAVATTPQWLFQGMESMSRLAAVQLCFDTVLIALVWLFVRAAGDEIKYVLIFSLVALARSICGVIVAARTFGVVPARPSLRGMWQVLREGAHLFVSRSSISLFAAGNAFIAGMLGGTTAAAYYFAGEKVIKAASALLGPLSQALYPRMVRLRSESEGQLFDLGRRVMILMAGASFLVTLVIMLGAPLISDALFGATYRPSIAVLRILAPWVFINGITNVWGVQIMMPLHLDRSLSVIFIVSGLANIVLALALVPVWGEVGMAVSVLISCLIVTAAMPVILWRKGIDPFRIKRRHIRGA